MARVTRVHVCVRHRSVRYRGVATSRSCYAGFPFLQDSHNRPCSNHSLRSPNLGTVEYTSPSRHFFRRVGVFLRPRVVVLRVRSEVAGRLSKAVVDGVPSSVGVVGDNAGRLRLYLPRRRVHFLSALTWYVSVQVFCGGGSVLVHFSRLFDFRRNVGRLHLPFPDLEVKGWSPVFGFRSASRFWVWGEVKFTQYIFYVPTGGPGSGVTVGTKHFLVLFICVSVACVTVLRDVARRLFPCSHACNAQVGGGRFGRDPVGPRRSFCADVIAGRMGQRAVGVGAPCR